MGEGPWPTTEGASYPTHPIVPKLLVPTDPPIHPNLPLPHHALPYPTLLLDPTLPWASLPNPSLLWPPTLLYPYPPYVTAVPRDGLPYLPLPRGTPTSCCVGSPQPRSVEDGDLVLPTLNFSLGSKLADLSFLEPRATTFRIPGSLTLRLHKWPQCPDTSKNKSQKNLPTRKVLVTVQ